MSMRSVMELRRNSADDLIMCRYSAWEREREGAHQLLPQRLADAREVPPHWSSERRCGLL